MQYVAVTVLAAMVGSRLPVKADHLCGLSGFSYNDGTSECGSCYTFDLVIRTWTQARDYCRSQGGDLVSIETVGENEFLKRVIRRNRYHSLIKGHMQRDSWFGFWTSGSDQAREGTWIWKATGSHVKLNNWTPGNPDNFLKKEHFLSIVASNGKWNDLSDPHQCFSICERARFC